MIKLITRYILLAMILAGCTFEPPGVPVNDTGSDVSGRQPPDSQAPATNACGLDAAQLRASNNATIGSGSREYVIGNVEIEAGNLDPYVARLNGSAVLWCAIYSRASTGQTGEHVSLAADGTPWVVFHTSTNDPGLTATEGAYQSSIVGIGNETISYLARLGPDNGAIEAGTFVHSYDKNRRARELLIRSVHLTGGGGPVVVQADAARTPPPFSRDDCSDKNTLDWTGTFNPDLTQLLGASSNDCQLDD